MLAASLAKHIYVKLFDWITEQLNRWRTILTMTMLTAMITTILTMTMLTAMTILTMTMLNRWMSADVVCAEGEDKKTTLEKAPLSLYQLHVLRPYTCYTCYTYCARYYGDAREGAALTILATRTTLAIFTALTTATLGKAPLSLYLLHVPHLLYLLRLLRRRSR